MGDAGQVKETMEGICELIGFAKLTTVEESRNLFPTLAISAPFMVNLLEQEQEKLDLQAERICEVMDLWEDSLSNSERRKLGMEMMQLFNQWTVEILQYLNRQQSVAETLVATEEEAQEKVKFLVAAA
jgi:hypothetical protein